MFSEGNHADIYLHKIIQKNQTEGETIRLSVFRCFNVSSVLQLLLTIVVVLLQQQFPQLELQQQDEVEEQLFNSLTITFSSKINFCSSETSTFSNRLFNDD